MNFKLKLIPQRNLGLILIKTPNKNPPIFLMPYNRYYRYKKKSDENITLKSSKNSIYLIVVLVCWKK